MVLLVRALSLEFCADQLAKTVSQLNHSLQTLNKPSSNITKMTAIDESRSSGSSTPSSNFPDDSQDLAIAKAVFDGLSAVKAARAGGFHHVTQTTVLRDSDGISDRIEIAVTAQKQHEPIVDVTHLPQNTPKAMATAQVTVSACQAEDANEINEVLEKAPKRVVPRRGMSSDYGIGF